MSDRADLEELARRYLDLWQDQVTALANDRETAEAMERLLQLSGLAGPPGSATGAGAAGPWAAWPAAMMAAMGSMASGARPPAPDGAQGAAHGQAGDAGSGNGGTAPAADGGPGPAEASRTQTAAGPPGGGAGDMDELLRRLAALEERIAALESGDTGQQRKPQTGSRKRRS